LFVLLSPLIMVMMVVTELMLKVITSSALPQGSRRKGRSV
jgi:hypothetical protein